MTQKKKWLHFLVLVCFLAQTLAFTSYAQTDSDKFTPPAAQPPQARGSEELVNPELWKTVPPPLPLEIFEPPTPSEGDAPLVDSLDEQSPALLTTTQQWADKLEVDAGKMLQLRSQVFERADQSDKSYGSEKTNKDIKLDLIAKAVPGFGTMKLSIFEDDHGSEKRIAIFEYAGDGRAFIFYKNGEIDQNSLARKRLEQRMHVDSKTGLKKEVILPLIKKPMTLGVFGRDVTFVEMSRQGAITGTEESNKAKPSEARWWSDQFWGRYRKPTPGEKSAGLALGFALQGAATLGVAALRAHGLENIHGFQGWFPIGLSATYGLALGIYNQFYYRYAYKGNFQAVKQMFPISLSFAYLMMLGTGNLDEFSTLTFHFTTWTGLLMNKNFNSIPWSKTTSLRTQLKLNTGEIKFSVFNKQIVWDRPAVERSLIYIMPFCIKISDTYFRAKEHIPFVGLWDAHMPQIPLLTSFMHTSFPYISLFGALVMNYLHLWYVYSLSKRPISEKWPENKALDAKRAYEEEKGKLLNRVFFIRSKEEVQDDPVLSADAVGERIRASEKLIGEQGVDEKLSEQTPSRSLEKFKGFCNRRLHLR